MTLSGETVAAETLQIVVFSLMDEASKRKEDYGVGIEQVREIRPLESITRVPKAPNDVRGVTNLRGKIISVIDLKEKLGFRTSGETSARSRILVTEIDGTLSGLLVDEVDRVMRVSTKDVEPYPSQVSGPVHYIIGVAKTQGRLILLLDLQKLLEGSNNQQRGKTKNAR